MSRQSDLENLIRRAYEIVPANEHILSTATDPKEKARARQQIDEQRALIRQWIAEYRGLSRRMPEDVAQIAAWLDAAPGPPAEPGQPRASQSSAALRERYLRALVQACRALALHTVDRRAAGPRVTALDLDAVFTTLDVLAPPERETLRARPEEPAERRIPVTAALSAAPYVVLLGDPGSGKSTLVNMLTLALAGDALGDSQVNRALLGAAWKLPPSCPCASSCAITPRGGSWRAPACGPFSAGCWTRCRRKAAPWPPAPTSCGTSSRSAAGCSSWTGSTRSPRPAGAART